MSNFKPRSYKEAKLTISALGIFCKILNESLKLQYISTPLNHPPSPLQGIQPCCLSVQVVDPRTVAIGGYQ